MTRHRIKRTFHKNTHKLKVTLMTWTPCLFASSARLQSGSSSCMSTVLIEPTGELEEHDAQGPEIRLPMSVLGMSWKIFCRLPHSPAAQDALWQVKDVRVLLTPLTYLPLQSPTDETKQKSFEPLDTLSSIVPMSKNKPRACVRPVGE